MKNKLSKIILSIILTISVLFSLSGCVMIEGVVGSGETLKSPIISVDESKGIVYWDSVDGANRYNVTVNGNTETVKTTFYGYLSLNDGEYEISVKALPSSSLDQPSAYSNKVIVKVGNTPQDDNTQREPETQIDYEELINGVTETAMQANVTVFLTMKKTIGSTVTAQSRSQGSGIIYKKRIGGYSGKVKYVYRVITNNHVIYQDTSKYNSFEYTVTDMYNKEYEATLLAYDPTYDLAVIEFEIEEKTENKQLNALSFADANAKAGDKIISLGQPLGQKNSIYLGKVVGLASPTITVNPNTAMSNVKFEVYRHDAPINSGSSGGAILDYNYNIIGINYASSTDANGKFLNAFAVPIEKVKEFLLAKSVS